MYAPAVENREGSGHLTPKSTGAPPALRDGPMPDAVGGTGEPLGRKGTLAVRLADSREEIAAAQRLRYKVFYEEMAARPDEAMRVAARDFDAFDDICDHLLVIEQKGEPVDDDDLSVAGGIVVGTYRLLRDEVARAHGGFYTADEFDIGPLMAAKGDELRFLELGRSCVLKPYRTKPTVELLWQGIWNYVRLHKMDVMFGCASLEGTDPDELALPLSFLHHHCLAPEEWRVRALPGRGVDMDRIPLDDLDPKDALRALPPLIKGYLRLGAHFGEGAVVDHQFNTTDVLIVLPVSAINERYFSHFGAPDERPGA